LEGFETTFVVNYLSRFLLTHLLLHGGPMRIIEVSGAYHAKGKIHFDDLQLKKNYSGAKANNQSKLANVLFTYELARRLKETKVTVNCMHPGFVKTDIIKKDPDCPKMLKFLYAIFSPFAKTPKQGAQAILHLACSKELEGISGRYYSGAKLSKSSKDSYDESLARRLWDVSEKLIPEELEY